MFNRSPRIAALVATAAAALAIAPAAANAATASLTPASGGTKTTFHLKVAAAPVRDAQDNGGYADLKLTRPAGTSSKCTVHNIPSYNNLGSKLQYDLSPNMLYSHSWCKGTWKLAVVLDLNGDGSDVKTIAKLTFKVR
jgi:uncharacterized protein (DUF2141 family)